MSASLVYIAVFAPPGRRSMQGSAVLRGCCAIGVARARVMLPGPRQPRFFPGQGLGDASP
jgi:hypothetical protein